MSETLKPLKTVGHATPRIDALERVTGQARYTNDIKLPGLLKGVDAREIGRAHV